MNENIVKRNELLAQKVIKGLESRNMTGYYAETKEEALRIALEIIPKGSSVTMGGAMSAHEIGLVEALKSSDYNFIDRQWIGLTCKALTENAEKSLNLLSEIISKMSFDVFSKFKKKDYNVSNNLATAHD